MNKLLYYLTTAMILFLSACTPSIRKPQLPDFALSSAEQTQLASRLKETQYFSQYLRALYRVQIKEGDSSNTIRQAVITRPPQRFRLESLPVNGFYTLNLLTIADGQASFIDQTEKRQINSADIDSLVQNELGLPVPAEFLGYLFFAKVPPEFLDNYNWQAYKLDADTILVIDGAQTVYWYLSADTLSLKAVQFWQQFSEQLSLQIDYIDFDNFAEHSLPVEMNLSVPRLDLNMHYRVQQLKLSEQVAESLFALDR